MEDSFLGFDEKNWLNLKKDLKKIVGETAYNNWLKQLTFLSVKDQTISFSVPTKFLRDWIVNHYADKIKEHFQKINNNIEVLTIVVKPIGGRIVPGTARIVKDDEKKFLSSVLFVEFDDWKQVRKFVDNEPHNKNSVYSNVYIRKWGFALKRRQVDFPRKENQINWYIRGHGRTGMHEKRQALLSAHRAYFKPYDIEHFIARGPIFSDEGEEWQGSANLISLPDRETVEEFLAKEPYYANDLYERVIIERYKFGGRPDQVV